MTRSYESIYRGNHDYLLSLMMAAVEHMGDVIRSDTEEVALYVISLNVKQGYDIVAAEDIIQADAALKYQINYKGYAAKSAGWWIETPGYDNACGLGLAFAVTKFGIHLHFAKPKLAQPEYLREVDLLIDRKVEALKAFSVSATQYSNFEYQR